MEENIIKSKNGNSKWVLGILIGIIVECLIAIYVLAAYRLMDNVDIVNIIAISSSLLSISLGTVAIFYAGIQTIHTKNQNKILDEKLARILKEQSEIFDVLKQTNGIVNEAVEDAVEKSKDEDGKLNEEKLKTNIQDNINKDIDISSLKRKLNSMNKSLYHQYIASDIKDVSFEEYRAPFFEKLKGQS